MANYSLSTERAAVLIEQLLGQRAAFVRFLTAKAGPAAAEDILQSCYLKVVEKGPQLQKDESVISWFYTVLRHATVDYYRRNATRDRAHEQFASEAPFSYEEEIKANICGCLSGVLDFWQVTRTAFAFSASPARFPAKSQSLGLRQRQYRRRISSSFGDSMTWRGNLPLPSRMWMPIRPRS
jgi:hypothetical protein